MLLVFGSINADLLFRVERLPMPGETVLCPGYTFAPGGKGANQATAAARAGAAVRFVGQVGDDGYGQRLRAGLEEAGVEVSGLWTSRRPTGIAVIGVDAAGENSIIVGSGANLDVHHGQVPDGELGPGTTVLCQNELQSSETFTMLGRAKARGARTVLNVAPARGVPDEVLRAVDVLVVNAIEARVTAGSQEPDPAALARALAGAHDLACVITLGAQGAVAATPRAGWRVPALPVEVVDTTGAGDTFVGVLAAALHQGLPMQEALRRASVGAALACREVGAQTAQPSAAAIEERLADLRALVPLD